MAKKSAIGSERFRGNRNYSRHLRELLNDMSQSRMAALCQIDKSVLEKLENINPNTKMTRQTAQTAVDAFNLLFNDKKYWTHEPMLVTFEELCTRVQAEAPLSRETEQAGGEMPEPHPDGVDQVAPPDTSFDGLSSGEPRTTSLEIPLAFSIAPIPGVGANFRPDPSIPYDDEDVAYCFMGQFHLRALQDCEIYQILMHVVREGRYPLVGCPGRSSYSHGPDTDGRSGSIKFNGENCYLDGNYHLHKFITISRGSLSSLATSRYCKPARYPDERGTSSIWYWIDNPEQILELRYIRDGINFSESHHFYFPEHILTFQKASVRRLSEGP